MFASSAVTAPTGGFSRPTPLECRALIETQSPIEIAITVPQDGEAGEAREAQSYVSGGAKPSCGLLGKEFLVGYKC